MKKIISGALMLVAVAPMFSFNASEINPYDLDNGDGTYFASEKASTVTGNWYSGQEYDLNGISTVGTTNVNGASATFNFYLQDEYGNADKSCEAVTVGNDDSYSCTGTLMSPGSRAGRVKTGSEVRHQPWLNA